MREPTTEHFLVRSPNWLGDACMALPALRALKSIPNVPSLTLLSPENLKKFWELVPEVDAVIPRPNGASLHQTVALIRYTAMPFTRGILFPNSSRSALEMKLAGIKNLTGFRGNWRSLIINDIVPIPGTPGEAPPPHQKDKYLAIAHHLGATAPNGTPPPPAKRLVGPPVIGICPGAEYGAAKRWPTSSFAQVMKMIHSHAPATEFILLGVKKEIPLGDALAAEYAHPLRNLIGQTTLSGLITELQRCHLLITNDTGTMHLADALGVPVTAIFGSTEPAISGPTSPHAIVVRRHVACSPCFLRECPIDFPCMTSVTPNMVATAAYRILSSLV